MKFGLSAVYLEKTRDGCWNSCLFQIVKGLNIACESVYSSVSDSMKIELIIFR